MPPRANLTPHCAAIDAIINFAPCPEEITALRGTRANDATLPPAEQTLKDIVEVHAAGLYECVIVS